MAEHLAHHENRAIADTKTSRTTEKLKLNSQRFCPAGKGLLGPIKPFFQHSVATVPEGGPVHENLRDRLRAETRAPHNRVDHAFKPHDLADYSGYVSFLSAHWLALGVLAADRALPVRLLTCIRVDRANLQCDLARLGRPTPPPLAAVPRHYHPLAVEYLLIGSSLGFRVLERRRAAACDRRVLSSTDFLRGADRSAQWRQLCGRLGALPARSTDADIIVSDCMAIFEIYTRAATHAAPTLEASTLE